MTELFIMRSPCQACGNPAGYVKEANGQDVVRCNNCDGYAYCRPRAESGKAQRSVSTRPTIKPKKRQRILEAFAYRCVMCGSDRNLHVDHIIPLAYGIEAGLSEDELNDDDNLCCLCEECNLGRVKDQPPSNAYVLKVWRLRRMTAS